MFIEFVMGLVLLAFMGIPVAWAYKHRAKIKRWVKDEEYGSEWCTDSVKRAERRLVKAQWKAADAEAQLAWEREKDEKEKQRESDPDAVETQ